MLKVILFDMDGTIIDSEKIAADAIRECCNLWHIPIEARHAEKVIGVRWDVAINYLYREFALPLPQERASEIIAETYRKRLKENLQVIPGVIEAIRWLAKDYKLGLVSGSHKAHILWALEKLQVLSHFQIVLGAEDYDRSKPAPDGYLKALKFFAAEPHEALVFEDSIAGIGSAKNAKIPVVAVHEANHFGLDLSEADARIKNFTEVGEDWLSHLQQTHYSAIGK